MRAQHVYICIMDPVLYVVIGFAIIFLGTTLGSALVFIFKKDISPRLNTIFLGFAAGVMIAAAVWSLIDPALEQGHEFFKNLFPEREEGDGLVTFLGVLPAVGGIVLGCLFLLLLDHIIPHIHKTGNEEGIKSRLNKEIKFFLAVTIHNIPEGLTVGFAFGAAWANVASGGAEVLMAPLAVAIGMAIQNFPEGATVALPFSTELNSKTKGFLLGSASGIVEPIAAIIGFFLSFALVGAQPWFLAFGAGAMIFVVIEDIIPDAMSFKKPHLATWSAVIGFLIMMALDVTLG